MFANRPIHALLIPTVLALALWASSACAEDTTSWRLVGPDMRARLESTDADTRERALREIARLGARAADWLPLLTKRALDPNPGFAAPRCARSPPSASTTRRSPA